MSNRHIATHIATRLEIHDETEWVQEPRFGCPDTYDSDCDGEGGMTYWGKWSSTLEDLLDQLDDS